MKILITGASSGIGKALAIKMAENPAIELVLIGRRTALLKSIKENHPHIKITCITADIANENDRQKIVAALQIQNTPLTHVIHNAGTIEPITLIKDLKLEEFRRQMAVNVEGPLFLTQGLLPFFNSTTRILFISSGAALKPYYGIGSYSISKAAEEMVCHVFENELNHSTIKFAILNPGLVNTEITARLANAPVDIYPLAQMIETKHREKSMTSPEIAANFIADVLFNSTDADYSKRWDINLLLKRE